MKPAELRDRPSRDVSPESAPSTLDAVLDNIDLRLADVLANAGKVEDEGTRKTELAKAKALLMQYISYVKSETLIADIDQNPFGVKTNLRSLLASGLTNAAKAIG